MMHMANSQSLGVGLPDVFPSLTTRQREVLLFLLDFARQRSEYPTYSEIANQFSVSRPTAGRFLEQLVKKGYIEKDTKSHIRNIRVTSRGLRRLEMDDVLPELQKSLFDEK